MYSLQKYNTNRNDKFVLINVVSTSGRKSTPRVSFLDEVSYNVSSVLAETNSGKNKLKM